MKRIFFVALMLILINACFAQKKVVNDLNSPIFEMKIITESFEKPKIKYNETLVVDRVNKIIVYQNDITKIFVTKNKINTIYKKSNKGSYLETSKFPKEMIDIYDLDTNIKFGYNNCFKKFSKIKEIKVGSYNFNCEVYEYEEKLPSKLISLSNILFCKTVLKNSDMLNTIAITKGDFKVINSKKKYLLYIHDGLPIRLDINLDGVEAARQYITVIENNPKIDKSLYTLPTDIEFEDRSYKLLKAYKTYNKEKSNLGCK